MHVCIFLYVFVRAYTIWLYASMLLTKVARFLINVIMCFDTSALRLSGPTLSFLKQRSVACEPCQSSL